MLPWQKKSFKNYYKILEVDFEASLDVIKAAYKVLIKKYHPDLNPDIDQNKMLDINEAYDVITDPVKSLLYKESYLDFFETSLERDFKRAPRNQASFQEKKEAKESKEEKSPKVIHDYKYYVSTILEKNIAGQDYSEEVNDLSDLYYKTSEQEAPIIAQALQKLPRDILQLLLKKILSFHKLGMLQENLSLGLVLDINLSGFEVEIAKAFKYKSLYSSLFIYIKNNELEQYLPKIDLVIEQTSFGSLESFSFIKELIAVYASFYDREQTQKLKIKIKKQIKKHNYKVYFKESQSFKETYKRVMESLN